MPGSPADHAERELALASQRPLPATVQEVELLLAPGERGGKGAGAEAPRTARAHDPKRGVVRSGARLSAHTRRDFNSATS